MKRNLHRKQSQPCHQHAFRLFPSHLTLHIHAVVVKLMGSDPKTIHKPSP
mgnify:CR=1 FL=1